MKTLRIYSLFIVVVLINGCSSVEPNKTVAMTAKTVVMTAKYTAQPVVMNGNIDTVQWSKAPRCNLNYFPASTKKSGKKLTQGGYVKFLWDKNFLYVGAKLIDYDIVATKNKDQAHHYAFGDLVEVFIKSVDGPSFGEFHSTPFSNKTSIFFPSRGRQIFPECAKELLKNFKVSVKLDGSLNNWKDKDKGWSTIVAIPLKGLKQNNIKISPQNTFRVMVSRINYGYFLNNKEYSSFPSNIGKPRGFHSYEHWGILSLEK